MRRIWAVAGLATGLLLAAASAAGAQLRVGPEVDLSGPGLGGGPVLSYDSTRGGWLAFWFADDNDDDNPRVISRYINPDLRPKQDSDAQFGIGLPTTAAYDPVAEEHVLTTGNGYWSTASVRRFSPMGTAVGGPWKLETGSLVPSVALNPSTGAGIVAYIAEPEFDEGTTVWAQRLAPGGGPDGAPVRLSQLATGVKVDFHRPAVAFNPARNEFAVAWRERRSGIGAYVGDIVMTRLGAGGPIGMPTAISDSRTAIVAQDPPGDIPDGAGAPGLAYDTATGGYLATWLGARGDLLESRTQVYGQRLDGELREVGPDDFRISAGPGTVDWDAFPTVVANDGMVVVWRRWVGDVPQVVGRRVSDSAPAAPDVLWTYGPYGLYGSPELSGPASGPLLLGIAVDTAAAGWYAPHVRRLGDGADPGTARIVDGPAGTSASATASFTLEAPGSLQCRLGEAPWRACQRSHVLANLSDGRQRLEVRASGPGGWVQAEPAAAEWRVETGPPDTRITETPAANDQLAGFKFQADEPSSFECRFDDAPWARCDFSGSDAAAVTNGLHRFEARAIDDAGHVDPTPATWIWTHDSDPPETWIDDGPADFTHPPGTFVFRSDEPGVRYECTDLNAGDVGVTWSPCQSDVVFPTRHDFVRARAIDTAGNVDGSPAQWRWRAEEARPTVEQISATGLGPDRTSPSRDVTMTFRVGSVSANSTVEECRLDGGAWQRCASPHRMEGLSDGAHVFEARSNSRSGVVGAVSQFAFSVDTQRPTTYILVKPRTRTLLRTTRFEFAATRPATFTCHVDGVARPCTSPLVLDDLGVGTHNIRIRATGAGGWTEPFGLVDHTWSVVSDPNAPVTGQALRATRALAAAPPQTLLDVAPSSQMRTNTASFEWDWLDTDDVVGSECKLDGGDWAPCSSPWRLEGLAEGAHHFEIRTVNRAGERDPTPVAVDWTVDTITAHIVWEAGPNSRTNRDPVTIAFRADRAGATFECRGADGPWQPCTSPYTAQGPEGAYRLSVRAVNRGRIGPDRTLGWIVDRTPPDTELRSQRVTTGMTTSRREIDFEVRALDITMVEFDGEPEPESNFDECRLDGGPWTWCAALDPVENLGDGPHVLEARVTDSAGNVDETPARIAWTVDTGAADTFIDGGPAATVESRTATFTLRAQPAGGGFECRLDGGAWRACGTTYTLTGVADGSHTLEARAIGGPPDATPASWLWTVDAEPTPTVLSGPLERSADSTARFRLAADDAAARIECRLDGGGWQPCGTEPAFPGLADGDHTLEVRAVDGGGRTGVLAQPWRWSVDTQAPDTLLVSGPEPLRRWRDAEIAFRSDEAGVRFQCRRDGGAWETCRSPHWIGGLSDATHTLDVRAVDAIGNADATPGSASWRVDATAPSGTLTSSPSLGWKHGTKITAATFTATGNEPLSAVECRVDERPWAPCRDGAAIGGFAEGPHQAEARLVDEAGNVGYTDLMPWSNGRPVDTEIVRRPKAAEFSTSATFEYSGDRGWMVSFVAFRCSLDGGPWESCTTQPRSYSGLALGHHVFEVAAVDPDGERDATPARWEWDIYPQPETTITEGPPATTTDTSAHFAFSSNQPGSTFLCKLDGASSFTACPTPFTVPGLSEGPHTLEVYARGPAGNRDHSPAVWNWTVTSAAAATSTPQVAREAAEAVSRALAGPRWRRVLSGHRAVIVGGAPGVLTIRVRARSRLVAATSVRMTRSGRNRVALRPYRRARPGSRARVQAAWRSVAGQRQTWGLTTTMRR